MHQSGKERFLGLAHFYENAFRSLGHNVYRFPLNVDKGWSFRVISAINSKMVKSGLYEFSPDLDGQDVISYAKRTKPDLSVVIRGERLKPETIHELDNISSIGCINIYPDNPFVIPGPRAALMMTSLREYKIILTFSKSLIPVFYQLGATRVEWLPFAYDPSIHYQIDKTKNAFSEVIPVSYVGTWGLMQEKWLKPLAKLGLKIYGNSWDYLMAGSPLRPCWVRGEGQGAAMSKVIANSKIVFNLVRAEHGCAHSMKTFEIPACGGFMLTNWTEEQAMFFEEGKECVFFRTMEGMLDKVEYYLFNEGERERIRHGGLVAVSGHTYEARALAIIKMIE